MCNRQNAHGSIRHMRDANASTMWKCEYNDLLQQYCKCSILVTGWSWHASFITMEIYGICLHVKKIFITNTLSFANTFLNFELCRSCGRQAPSYATPLTILYAAPAHRQSLGPRSLFPFKFRGGTHHTWWQEKTTSPHYWKECSRVSLSQANGLT